MSELEKARNALANAHPRLHVPILEALIDAKVNAILDAREAKAPAPDDGGDVTPGDRARAAIGELERAIDAICDGTIKTLPLQLAERRAEEAEASLAELRERVIALKTITCWWSFPAMKIGIVSGPKREAAICGMFEALAGLVKSATAEVNEKGAGGYHLARLSDAKDALAAARSAGIGGPDA